MVHNRPTPDNDPFRDLPAITPEELAFFAEPRDSASGSLGRMFVQKPEQKAPEEATLEVFGDEEDVFVESLRDLRSRLHLPESATVVYPGSSTHVGVARVFGREQVTHVDPDRAATRGLQAVGYQAEQCKIEDYAPAESHDLMVALNSYGRPKEKVLRRVLKPGGYIITNNYTQWAHDISKNTHAALVGAVLPSYLTPNATYVPADELVDDPTAMSTTEYRISREGRMLQPGEVSEESFMAFNDTSPRYPDALFVFQMPK